MKHLYLFLLIVAVLPLSAEDAELQEALKKMPPIPLKQESVADVKAPSFALNGGFIGTPLTVDAAFTTKYEHTPPVAPFKVVVPRTPEVLVLPGGKKSAGNSELVKFSTGTKDKRAIEILRLTDLKVPMQSDPADRLKLCAELLKTQGLPGTTNGYEKVAFIESYAMKIGDADAVCVHAHMTKPGSGEHYAVKLVGILHPGKEGGVLAFLMADTERSEIRNPPDLSSKGTGLKIIHSLRFIDAPAGGKKP